LFDDSIQLRLAWEDGAGIEGHPASRVQEETGPNRYTTPVETDDGSDKLGVSHTLEGGAEEEDGGGRCMPRRRPVHSPFVVPFRGI